MTPLQVAVAIAVLLAPFVPYLINDPGHARAAKVFSTMSACMSVCCIALDAPGHVLAAAFVAIAAAFALSTGPAATWWDTNITRKVTNP